ncbi:hypothetical protein V8B97DRAFT_2104394 [Scleroderma yunnanense]
MARQKSSLNKKPLIPKSPSKRKTPSSENSSLEAIHHIKEVGKQAHLQAEKMQKAYDGHIHWGCKWLQSHTGSSSTIPASIVKDIYNDPRFKDAFENIPNHYSDKALALYLSWRGFHENQSQSTVEGVHAAFKKLDGDTYCKKWHYNEAWQCWEGNPVTSAKVDDVMASIKHKVSTEGSMKKEYMDKILTWSMTTCPELESTLHFISLVLTRSASASSLHGISDDMKKHVTWYLGLLAFASTAWIIWTRCFELVKLKQEDIQIMDTTLVNHVLTKYLRGEQDTLTTNERDVYYEIHLRNWKGWQKKVEHVQLGRAMVDGDYIFPAIGANGVLKPCKPLSQDAIQKWISEATMGTGIEGTFTTHCFRRGGAQYWFMYAPVGQRWPLSTVRWWGGWADGEHRDTLIRYLLDELHSYENDHSNTLGPFPCEADMSLAGEHALAAPATREELWMFQSSVSTEIRKLDNNIQAILRNVTNSLQDLTQVVRSGQLSTTASYLPPPSGIGSDGAPTSPLAHPLHWLSRHSGPTTPPPAVSPSLVTTESDTLTYSSPSPFIPDVPFTHADGTITPRNKAWRDVIQHWEKGVPEKRLPPLRDWPYEYTHGPNRNLQSKYNQRRIIALEFLNRYKGDEKKFVEAYEVAVQKGITSLLHAITAARQQRDGLGPVVDGQYFTANLFFATYHGRMGINDKTVYRRYSSLSV